MKPDDPNTGPRDDRPVELSADDRRLLDRLMDAGFDDDAVAALPEDDRRRAERLFGLLGLLDDYPVEDAEDALVHATLARIDRHEADLAARLAFDGARDESPASRGRSRIRLPDFISVAAVILIAAGVLWPLLASMRQRSYETRCANNLRQVGYAFSHYAADNDGELPIARAGLASTWDTVSNVLNLGPLLEGGYCELGHLDCPGVHDHDFVDASYSYQWHAPESRPVWGTGRRVTIVLGDRNPLIDAFRAGRSMPATTISFNHGGRGQNVLASDGATLWLERPLVAGGDNIWLPDGLHRLRPGVSPAGPGDVFLAH